MNKKIFNAMTNTKSKHHSFSEKTGLFDNLEKRSKAILAVAVVLGVSFATAAALGYDKIEDTLKYISENETYQSIFVDGVISSKTSLVKDEVRNVTVVDYNPPKRFYVTVQDDSTGEKKEFYISKRCYGVRSDIVGMKLTVNKKEYETVREIKEKGVVRTEKESDFDITQNFNCSTFQK